MTSHDASGAPVISIEDLAVSYQTRKGQVNAVRNVTCHIEKGEAFGLVGESGCGKSTVAFSIVNSLGRNGHIDAGRIVFQGSDLVGRREAELQQLRGSQISMVYQDPMQALNPCLRIGEQLSEVLTVHQKMRAAAARARCLEMLKRVYMPDPELIMRRYPHQLSGGQQQRVIIAMALLNNPALLIMDEPTTALDVTVEAAVLDLIDELRRELQTAILYISHNLGVVARVCSRVGIMYSGEMVERAPVAEVFAAPLHPYTAGLLRCIPQLGASKESSYLTPIRGQVPRLDRLPSGCLFEPRCDMARDRCRAERPTVREVRPGHVVRCHFADELAAGGLPHPKAPEFTAPARAASAAPLLKLDSVRTYYEQESTSLLSLVGLGRKRHVRAVDGVSLELPKGATLGIVGESGCGKSTLARTIVGLEAPTSGRLEFLGVDISSPASQRAFEITKELQMVFQNPDSTLNPSFPVGYQISRPLRRMKKVPAAKVHAEVVRLLRAVKLDESYYHRQPRQLSGGQKQRVAIARAIATYPELVICDEPVSALDVSVQASILNLLLEVQREYGTALAFISHDLSVVRFFSDYVAVMYLGKVCEIGPAEAIYAPPYHPYTEALLSAVPVADPDADQKRIRLEGTVPSALNPPTGCHFHTRCPRKLGAICEREEPPEQDAGNGHRIYCHIALAELRRVEPVFTVAGRRGSRA
ncbi:MAG TPA: ABC transporter ATP-binding protein [Anaerolineae bacterium]|nr:ABC transporter ATP-binding protein [Anaerolineae bacterium]HOQ97405.1 ABC transporter ATP-binding protein [Anaerolineae bacterium]HPL27170.1 ABC transporter ATP-binding protein [Anaerolineae bacterium]